MSAEAALALLTAVLVFITGYYAWQTQQAVREMRRARELSVRPDLRPNMHIDRDDWVSFSIANVGQGPAIDVDLKLTYKAPPGVSATTEERQWRTHTIAPGERNVFYPPRNDPERPLSIEELITRYDRIIISGSVKDSLGSKHSIEQQVSDFRQQWDIMKNSGHRQLQPPLERMAISLSNIHSRLWNLSHTVEKYTKTLENQPPPDDDVPF